MVTDPRVDLGQWLLNLSGSLIGSLPGQTKSQDMQLLAGIAVTFGLLLSLFNWGSIFLSRPDKHVSPIPLLGGIFLAAGLLGFELTRPYWWLAAFADFGTLIVLLALPSFIYYRWSHSDRKARYIFVSTVGDRTVDIKLFENGDATIKISFDPPRPRGDRGHLAVSVGFTGKWVDSNDQLKLNGYAGGRELLIQQSADTFVLAETYPADDDPSIYAIDGLQVQRIDETDRVTQ